LLDIRRAPFLNAALRKYRPGLTDLIPGPRESPAQVDAAADDVLPVDDSQSSRQNALMGVRSFIQFDKIELREESVRRVPFLYQGTLTRRGDRIRWNKKLAETKGAGVNSLLQRR
jgi:hypothetical protein